MSKSGDEKRRWRRVAMDKAVEVKAGGTQYPETINDMSAGGLPSLLRSSPWAMTTWSSPSMISVNTMLPSFGSGMKALPWRSI